MFANKNVDFHFHVYTFVSIFNIALTLQVAKMFARADKNGDFHLYVTRIHFQNRFNIAGSQDVFKSRLLLSCNTFTSVFYFTFNLQVAKMFARADKNGDGKLDKEEWHRVLNSAGCRTSM